MRPLQRKRVFCSFLFLLSLFLTQRVLTLQEMHCYFLTVNECVAATQRTKQHLLLYFSRLVHDRRAFRQRNRRRAWAWPRPQNWFRVLLANRDMDSLWKVHFRVTRSTFNALCDLVRGDLQKQHTRMRSPVSVEERVAAGLWRLATGDSFKSCGLQFGIGMSTAKTICAEFELCLFRLKDQFIKFPLTRQELQELMDEFEEEYGIPQIVGAIDGCHIEINAPPDNHEDYFNRKQHYSVNLQAIANCELKFIHVSFGYPGSIHDARVLRLSGLFDLGENEQILTSPMKVVSGTEIPPLIIGDSAYPLLKWLVKPYPNRGHLPPDEREFNKSLVLQDPLLKEHLVCLKGRWRLLLKKVEQQTRTLSKTVLAACILHNICIDHGDLYDCSDSDSDDSDSEDN